MAIELQLDRIADALFTIATALEGLVDQAKQQASQARRPPPPVHVSLLAVPPITDDTPLPNPFPADYKNSSRRINNALERAGIRTIRELQAKSDDDILRIKNIGIKQLRLIREYLAETGVNHA